MRPVVDGFLGLGITLLVVGAAVASVNGLARGWAARKLYEDPTDTNARALLALF